jgi:co-chaperonin GroES (HSP10)
MNMRVIGNRLLISFVEEKKEENAILTAGADQKQSDRAVVVAVGNAIDIEVEVGEIVLVSGLYGNTVDVDGKVCHVVEAENVLMVLDGKEVK